MNKRIDERSSQERLESEIQTLSGKKRGMMSNEERVRLLQLKLYQKARQEPFYRFYVLYDKVFQPHILAHAYERVRKNGGSPGIDNQSFKDIAQYGVTKFLKELGEELRRRRYCPSAVKRVMIPKANGGERPLGIPTIKDRVAQYACKIVIEPLFEANFDKHSYGFRPKRSSADAVTTIKKNLQAGKRVVYDADLSKYFDTIPHDKLLIALKERIGDPRILHLIMLWLKAPVVEDKGSKREQKHGRPKGDAGELGTPQGGVISPLLANIYMNLLDRIVNNPKGYYAQRGIQMIRYADDFILMAPEIAQEALERVHRVLQRMELTINEQKSKLVNATEESFDFLGFTFRYSRSILYAGSYFWEVYPKKKSELKIRATIRETLRYAGHFPPEGVVARLNPIIRGWMNYYAIPKVSNVQRAFRRLDEYLRERLYRYYKRKSQRRSKLYGQKAYELLTQKYGLVVPYRTSGLRPYFAQ